MKPKVGILTTFYDLNKAYSLTSVVEAQLAALVKYGYAPVLFVHDNFSDDALVPDGVEVRKVIPRFLLVDYSNNQELSTGFEEQVVAAYEALKAHTADIEVIFEHDLIFQGWFLPYCVAIHKLASETNQRWFHWTHSVPNTVPQGTKYPHTLRYQLPARSKLVYLNNFHLIRAAESYGVFPKDVRVVYNPVDPRLYYDLHPIVSRLINIYDLLSADFMQVYPVSTTRMLDGKQLYTVIDIFAKLKESGRSVRLVVANAHANDKREKQVIAETLNYAAKVGLSPYELIFTSLEDAPKYETGIPREAVSQLFLLANLFIFPSISENCPLILLEAMMAKNMLILNNNVGPMREFAQENALYFNFGGLDDRVEYKNREQFMHDVARIIISEFETNRTLKVANRLKKDFNFDRIFKKQIEPLLYEDL